MGHSGTRWNTVEQTDGTGGDLSPRLTAHEEPFVSLNVVREGQFYRSLAGTILLDQFPWRAMDLDGQEVTTYPRQFDPKRHPAFGLFWSGQF